MCLLAERLCLLLLSSPMFRPALPKDEDDYRRSLVFERLPEAPFCDYYRNADFRYKHDCDLLSNIFSDICADGGITELFRMGGVWKRGSNRPLKVVFQTSHHAKNVLLAFRYFRRDFPYHQWSNKLRVRPSMSKHELIDYHASKNKAYKEPGVIKPIHPVSTSSPARSHLSPVDISLRSVASTSPISTSGAAILNKSLVLNNSTHNIISAPMANPITPIKLRRIASGSYVKTRNTRSLSPKPKACSCPCSCKLSGPLGHSSRPPQKSPSSIRSAAVSPSLLHRNRKRDATAFDDTNGISKRIAIGSSPGSGVLNISNISESVK